MSSAEKQKETMNLKEIEEDYIGRVWREKRRGEMMQL